MKKNIFTLSIICTLALVALFSACSQRYELTMPLAVTSRQLDLKSSAGSTHIMVYSNTAWHVKLENPVEWASLSKLDGEGFNDFIFNYSSNYGITRSVKIVVYSDSKTDTIKIVQAGEIAKPGLQLLKNRFSVSKKTYVLTSPLTSNLDYCINEVKAKATYYTPDGEEIGTYPVGSDNPAAWVKTFEIDNESASISVIGNESGVDRNATVSLYVEDYSAGSQTILSALTVKQSRLAPTFNLESAAGVYYANSRQYLVNALENNIWSQENIVTASAPWMHDGLVEEDGLSFLVDKNNTGADRTGEITVSYEDGGIAKFSVTQYHNQKLTFEELRECSPGKFSTDDILEGYVVSDQTSLNVCSSPQIGQYQFDRTQNRKTAYLESPDANYGVMLKFTTEEGNILNRRYFATINLQGATLVKQENPLRFSITGLTASSVSSQEDDGNFPEKKRTISQLTDNDIYTYVSLQNLEILSKDGCYTNVTDGYTLKEEPTNPYSGLAASLVRFDVAPLMCYDKDGKTIFMLTNMAAPWRRNGVDLGYMAEPKQAVVPQGSGTFNGVIVADDIAPVRWGDLGKYQIRAMQLEDIDFNEAVFTTTLVEWNWNDFAPAITPTIGGGTLDVTGIPLDSGGTGVAAKNLAPDYNNTYNGRKGDSRDKEGADANGNNNTNMKGLIAKAAMGLSKQWWNFSLGQGEYFDIKFNTANLSASNLFVGLVWGHDKADSKLVTAPSHWKALYSTDGGKTWNDVPGCDIIKNRSCVWWTDTSQDSCPGFTEHLIKLPSSCIGVSDCRVRFQVADTICDIVPSTSPASYESALGCEKGHLTAAIPPEQCEIVIGTLTVRCN